MTAQTHTFGGPGTEWYYSGHNAAPPEYSGYVHFHHEGDTMIANRHTNKLQVNTYNYYGDLSAEASILVAQESDTVLLYRSDSAEFTVLYVFNLNVGDTVTLDAPFYVPGHGDTYRLVVDSVRIIEYDGVPLKHYRTRALDDFYLPGELVDRIGGMGWFFPRPIGSIPEGPGEVRCYTDEQIDINFKSYPCDHHLSTSVTGLNEDIRFTIFPNPSTEGFYIESAHELVQVNVFDYTGRLVMKSNSAYTDIRQLDPGLYLIGIQAKSGKWHYRSLIKL